MTKSSNSRKFRKQAQDKRGGDLSIERMIADENMEPVMHEDAGPDMVEAPIFELDDQFAQKVKEYNESIMELDKDYASLNMLNENIVVRVILEEVTVSDSGVITKPVTTIPVKTGSGVGELYRTASPYPYTRKAVIVAVPQGYEDKFTPGDIVSVKDSFLGVSPVGGGDNVAISIKNEFIHPDGPKMTPQDPSDKHYGYLLVHPYEIICKL